MCAKGRKQSGGTPKARSRVHDGWGRQGARVTTGVDQPRTSAGTSVQDTKVAIMLRVRVLPALGEGRTLARSLHKCTIVSLLNSGTGSLPVVRDRKPSSS